MRATKTAKSAQTDTYYLREIFGKVCPELETRRVPIATAKKRPPKPGGDQRLRAPVVHASCFEEIRTADISTFISTLVEARSLAPKTANRYREILCRLFNWAIKAMFQDEHLVTLLRAESLTSLPAYLGECRPPERGRGAATAARSSERKLR